MAIVAAAILGFPVAAFAQTCPTPAVANGTTCTVTPGTTITVTPANAIGLNASGALGQIIGNGITVNLAAATTTGALAQSGSTIFFNGSTLHTTSTITANSAGQFGLRATGAGSTINAAGSSITMGPPNGTTAASNMTGATAEGGAALSLANTSIQMLGRSNRRQQSRSGGDRCQQSDQLFGRIDINAVERLFRRPGGSRRGGDAR